VSLGVVLPKNDLNLGDAFCSEIEGCNLFLAHWNENFELTGVGLLLRQRFPAFIGLTGFQVHGIVAVDTGWHPSGAWRGRIV